MHSFYLSVKDVEELKPSYIAAGGKVKWSSCFGTQAILQNIQLPYGPKDAYTQEDI